MKKLTSILVFIVGYINCHSQDFVMINKEKIHYEIKGSGEPWIVLVTGLGMELNEFDSIFYDLSKETTVLRYSRAGNGRSSYNNKRDDFDETVNKLELLINELNVPEPFILSGHSYGGLIIRAYAKPGNGASLPAWEFVKARLVPYILNTIIYPIGNISNKYSPNPA